MSKPLPAYYATRNLMSCEPDTNNRFIRRSSDEGTVATFCPSRRGWTQENERELAACVAALNALHVGDGVALASMSHPGKKGNRPRLHKAALKTVELDADSLILNLGGLKLRRRKAQESADE